MKKGARTLLEALRESLAASIRPAEGAASPVALLWTDAEGQWLPPMPTLRSVLPTLYTLGVYEPEARTGPAIWLKCITLRPLPGAPATGEIPILDLPRVGRQALRAAGDCPSRTQPLIELQYRGREWHQSNGHDWTVQAFPEKFRVYASACKRNEVKPGAMLVFGAGRLTGPRFLINFPTKRHWKEKSRLDDSGGEALDRRYKSLQEGRSHV